MGLCGSAVSSAPGRILIRTRLEMRRTWLEICLPGGSFSPAEHSRFPELHWKCGHFGVSWRQNGTFVGRRSTELGWKTANRYVRKIRTWLENGPYFGSVRPNIPNLAGKNDPLRGFRAPDCPEPGWKTTELSWKHPRTQLAATPNLTGQRVRTPLEHSPNLAGNFTEPRWKFMACKLREDSDLRTAIGFRMLHRSAFL